MKNKFLIKVGIGLITIFIAINIIWIIWVENNYRTYIKAFEGIAEKSEFSTWNTLQYNTDNRYLFSVKKPDYLSTVGNLSITYFTEDDDKYPIKNSIIIWPLKDNDYEYGVTLIDEYSMYNVYVDENLNIDYYRYNNVNSPNYDPIYYIDMIALLKKNNSEIEDLLKKANEIWSIN